MLVPYEWIKRYFPDLEPDVVEYGDRMTMSGTKLETIDYWAKDVSNVVCGEVKTIEPHPDSDHMVICMTDVGQGDLLQIVTGAPNVHVGDKIPTILEGGTLPDGKGGVVTIKPTKLRGVDSYGMFCSFSELGYPDKVVPIRYKDGVWILPADTPVGCDIVEHFKLNDATLDFEITPNRPDCLSILGIARETAATFDLILNYPFIGTKKELKEKLKNYISVEIRRPELCNRYCCRVVKNVKIGESPWYIQRRLMHSGIRPINNIVDITNYVMLEYGQPIHAFDLRQIRGGKLIIDTAKDGETFTTLDGQERTLDGEMLMIKDAERSLALAGVMGGLNSEIEDDTTTILIESANFTSAGIRRTSKKLGLRTEASFRFEKGVDANVAEYACDRVCSLIEAIGAGVSIRGMIDEYPRPYHSKQTQVRVTRINKLLGLDLHIGEMLQIFHRLEIDTQGFSSVVISVTPPSVRRDLVIEEDYAEEIARIYGYDRLPVTMPAMECQALKSPEQSFRDEMRDTLVGLGLDEITTYSFVSPKLADKVRDAADSPLRDTVKILNPLGEDTSVMRTALLPNLLEVLGRNSSRNNPKMVCFEIGNTFRTALNEEGIPDESYAIALGGYGEGIDFFALKGIVEALFDKLGLPAREYVALTDDPTYHPGRTAAVYAGGELLGRLGELHPEVAENFGVTGKAYGAEFAVDKLFALARKEIVYRPLPKFPGSSRDIALVIDEATEVGRVEDRIREAGGALLESVKLFDIYRGSQVPAGKKSVAYSLMYRSPDHTLTEDEVVSAHNRVLSELATGFNAALREL